MSTTELKRDINTWDFYSPIVREGNLIRVYLTNSIDEASTYNQLTYTLEKAQPFERVELFISNGGGYASSAFMLLSSMKKCKAPIHGIVEGLVASAATILTMGCDTIEVGDFTQFMCHNYFHGVSGSGSQVKDYVNFTDREFTEAAKIIYEGFLTEDEIKSISTQDKEIWLNATEVRDRWTRKAFRKDRLCPTT